MFVKATVLAALLSAAPALSTYFNGDVINGEKVITELDINNLEPCQIHRFYLKVAEINSGLPVHIPTYVAKGCTGEGKRMWLSSTIHGDELNPIRVNQKILQNLDINTLNGTIISAVHVNPLGTQRNQRFYETAPSSGARIDLNRGFPGSPTGSVTSRYNYAIWSGLAKNGTQVDVAIDMHTPSTGSDTPLWAYADWAAPGVERLSRLIGADIIKVDPGEPGSLETTFVEAGVPALTLEIGSPLVWQLDLIERSYDFVRRALAEYEMIPKEGIPAVPEVDTYAGTTFVGASARDGGFFIPQVRVNQYVEEGELLGREYNVFGDLIHNYTASASGRIHTLVSNPTAEPGRGLVTIITGRQ